MPGTPFGKPGVGRGGAVGVAAEGGGQERPGGLISAWMAAAGPLVKDRAGRSGPHRLVGGTWSANGAATAMLGAHRAQGYLFGKPESLSTIKRKGNGRSVA